MDFHPSAEVRKLICRGADDLGLAPAKDLPVSAKWVSPPRVGHRPGTTSGEFRAVKGDHSQKDAQNRALGRAGEDYAFQLERKRLLDHGQDPEAVRHVAREDGDGLGYDIKSLNRCGEVTHIEVKTTTGPLTTPFFLTPTELRFSQEHPEHYPLYRVHEFDEARNAGSIFKLEGDLTEHLHLCTHQYKAWAKP